VTEPQKNPDKVNQFEEKNTQPKKSLWKRRFIKFFAIVGLFIICFGQYTIWFIYGEPAIDTDYLAQLNQINRPKNYKQEDNAWPYYQKRTWR
jgi:zona occludens toxin (predicted ATPase)